MPRTQRRIASAAIYASFLSAFFVGLDLVLARFAPDDRSFRTTHPYQHHTLRPDRSATPVWGGRRYTLETNSLGLRDERVRTVAREAPGPRILLLGDSMIEGLGVEYPDTVAGLLAERTRERGVEILNGAVVSYSPRLYELKTRWLVEQEGLALDAVIVFLDISDIQDELHYEDFVPHATSGWATRATAWWQGHSLAWRAIERLRRERRGIDNSFRRDADIDVWLESVHGRIERGSDPEAGRWEWTYDEKLFDAWGRRGLALAERHMAALAAFCREHAIALTVVVYPSPYQIYANERRGRQVEAWSAFCAREKIRFVDLFPVFADPAGGPDAVYTRYFIDGDVHWNEAGHALVAGAIEREALGARGP